MHEIAYDLKELLKDLRDEIRELRERVAQLEAWRWRIAGGLVVAGLLVGLLAGLLFYVITHA